MVSLSRLDFYFNYAAEDNKIIDSIEERIKSIELILNSIAQKLHFRLGVILFGRADTEGIQRIWQPHTFDINKLLECEYNYREEFNQESVGKQNIIINRWNYNHYYAENNVADFSVDVNIGNRHVLNTEGNGLSRGFNDFIKDKLSEKIIV